MAASYATRARNALTAVGVGGRAVFVSAMRTGPARMLAGAPAAYTLLLVPPDLRTADASFAHELNDGYFGLGGAVALTGSQTPFVVAPPTLAWAEELYRFSWLNHLEAAGDELALEKARSLVTDWTKAMRSAPSLAFRPEIAGDRVIALLSHAGFVLDRSSAEFYDAYMELLTRELHGIAVSHSLASHTAARLKALSALLFAGLCIAEHGGTIAAHLPPFSTELERQILPDGGHLSRNPAALVEIALDLLPLKQCFLSRVQEPPEALVGALARLLPMLRFMRASDGSLARFNGMGATRADLVSAVLAYDDTPPPRNVAPESRYFRLEGGPVAIIADGGGPPPARVSTLACASCLAFEMSDGTDPLVVNCGAPRGPDNRWAFVARSTAAHSTLTINDTSSARLVERRSSLMPGGGLQVAPLRGIEAKLSRTAEHTLFTGSHPGYVERFGLVHARALRLAADGARLDGIDRLDVPPGTRAPHAAPAGDLFAIRFHIHPRVRASRDGNGLVLHLPSGAAWRFEATGAKFEVEESLFLADPITERATLQIVLSGPCMPHVQVGWAFQRLAGASTTRAAARLFER